MSSASEVRVMLMAARNQLAAAEATLDAARASRGAAYDYDLARASRRIESEVAAVRVRRWREVVERLADTARLLGVAP